MMNLVDKNYDEEDETKGDKGLSEIKNTAVIPRAQHDLLDWQVAASMLSKLTGENLWYTSEHNRIDGYAAVMDHPDEMLQTILTGLSDAGGITLARIPAKSGGEFTTIVDFHPDVLKQALNDLADTPQIAWRKQMAEKRAADRQPKPEIASSELTKGDTITPDDNQQQLG